MSAWTIRRVVSLIGTARPSPTPATAVLIPTTRPSPFASAPPELPGFSAASVCTTFSTSRCAPRGPTGSDRPSALTTPAVTLPPKPRGLPIATTSWPTRNSPASPRRAATRSELSARSTARSLSGSRPATVKRSSLPSANDATPPLARSTTWALVSRKPSGAIATALPAPRRSRTFATLGDSCCATRVTTCEYASKASPSVGRSSLTKRKPVIRRRYHRASSIETEQLLAERVDERLVAAGGDRERVLRWQRREGRHHDDVRADREGHGANRVGHRVQDADRGAHLERLWNDLERRRLHDVRDVDRVVDVELDRVWQRHRGALRRDLDRRQPRAVDHRVRRDRDHAQRAAAVDELAQRGDDVVERAGARDQV